jgi:aryl-alcohol dehydrogenase-like predicted oxidoreductase
MSPPTDPPAATLPDRATRAGTERYRGRHAAAVASDHFRPLAGEHLAVSSVGLGTYLGPSDDAADARYQAAIGRAIELGINVLDAAINYRSQRSERAVGRALAAAVRGGIGRDEIVVASKAGFLPLDAGVERAEARQYLERTYVASGLARPDEIVAGCHCLAPRYLEDQLARSRRNLGLETIDVYYLHNPETQLEEVEPATFLGRMRAAFEVLEGAAASGTIGVYGTATWNGYRQPPGAPDHLDLFALAEAAREVGGERHRFRVVQLPLNQRMPEAAEARTQARRGGTPMTLLEAAGELGMQVMSSASILQGKLAPDAAAARGAIDWVRSRPGLTTALIGMSRVEHVEANAAAFRR